MKVLSLTPYPGTIYYCESMKELKKKYKKLTLNRYPYEEHGLLSGQYIYIAGSEGQIWYLVYGMRPSTASHEFVHCLLHLFGIVGIDPSESKGEPLCYMLSRLMREAFDEEAMNE